MQAHRTLWIANRLDYDAANRNDFGIAPVARLKEGVTLQQAQSAADAVAAESRRTIPMDASVGYNIALQPMQQHLVAEVRPAILALMGSVIFLLLIACANVANLLLVRASLREQEFAVRAALGANRWRLIVPLFTEACLLAMVGTAAGLGLAWAGIRELRALAPENLPRLDTIHIDGTVLGFTALAGLAAALLFGIAPAWRATLPALMNVLRGSSRTSGLASGAAVRNAVVMIEVALSFMLLVGSGLMFRSFLDLQRIDPGFDAHNLLTLRVLGAGQAVRPQPGASPEARSAARAAMIRRIDDSLRGISGVQSVTASFPFPLTGQFSPIRWGTEEAQADPSKYQATDFEIVVPGYFETMRTPLLAGRTFTEDDNLPGRNNVIVDEALANKAFPGQSAVGKRILTGFGRRRRNGCRLWVWWGISGRNRWPNRAASKFIFPMLFWARAWFARGRCGRAAIQRDTRARCGRRLRASAAHLLIKDMEPAQTVVYDAQASTRFSLLLIAAFAAIAGMLAGVGLYGVLSTAVRQRTAEIGVRMAMGAERGDIVKLVVMQGLRLSGIGIVIGLIAALVLGRVMTAMLVGVKATDPVTLASMIVVFLAISAFASWVPAMRAAGLDPKTALHEN